MAAGLASHARKSLHRLKPGAERTAVASLLAALERRAEQRD